MFLRQFYQIDPAPSEHSENSENVELTTIPLESVRAEKKYSQDVSPIDVLTSTDIKLWTSRKSDLLQYVISI